ncbi:MAG: carotenoid biosynthesis protein [Cyclobacteriaceae bacterium]
METILRILQTGYAGQIPVDLYRYRSTAIRLVWVVHIAAMAGVVLGFQEWFISKTPFSLLLIAISLTIFYPVIDLKKFTNFIMIAIIAFYAEWLGVQFGLIFGDYTYGSNLGWKIDGVPFLISLNWAVLSLVTATLTKFWAFDGGAAPLQNYAGWFGLALVLQTIIQKSDFIGDYRISLHLYAVQLIFFAWFNVFFFL